MRLALLFLGASGLIGYAQSLQVEFEGRYWPTTLSGNAKIGAADLNTTFDLKKDLGVGNPQVGDFRFTLRTKNNRLQFGYEHFALDGDQPVTRTIEFKGQIYTAGSQVITDARINHIVLRWNYWAVHAAGRRFLLGPLLEGHGLWWNASLSAPALALAGTDKRTIGYPAAGLAAEVVAHKRLIFFAQGAGIPAGSYGTFYGYEAGARVSPVSHLFAVAGYRVFDVNAKFSPDYARVHFIGPFVGGIVRF